MKNDDSRKNNGRTYLPLYISIGTSVGSVFGAGLGVVFHSVLVLPICITGGFLIGTLFGMMVNKCYKNKKERER